MFVYLLYNVCWVRLVKDNKMRAKPGHFEPKIEELTEKRANRNAGVEDGFAEEYTRD